MYRYQLTKKGPKTDCPQCRHAKVFSQYIDNETSELLPDEYGRCDRESNCGYHLSPYHKGPSGGMSYAEQINGGNSLALQSGNNIPKEWFKAAFGFKRHGTTQRGITHTLQTMLGATLEQAEYVARYVHERPVAEALTRSETVHCIPDELFEASLDDYPENQLAILLANRFGSQKADELLTRFHVGTSSRWKGACIFWYIDQQQRVRGGQVKFFGADWHTVKYVNGKGEKKSCTTWFHSVYTYQLRKAGISLPDWLIAYNEGAKSSPCLFGLPQLLTLPIDQPVAIVEAPKTAIICTYYLPEFTWLAAGALSYLNAERLEPVRGRKIMLLPDLNAYQTWSQKADELRAKGFLVEVSGSLEQIATDEQRMQGWDLADYLLSDNEPNEHTPRWNTKSGVIYGEIPYFTLAFD